MSDSPRVRDQSSLTTSGGRIWLVVAGLLTALTVGLLLAMRDLRPVGVATIGLALIVAEYLVMIAIRFGVARLRVRLGLLAALTIAICLTFIVCASIIATTEWAAVG